MIKKFKHNLSKDTHLSELINSSMISFILRIMGIGLGYLFILLISRNFGAGAVGIFTLSFTVLQIMSVFGRFGLDTALLRFIAESASHDKMGEAVDTYTKAFKFSFTISFILSLIAYFSAPFLANVIFKNHDLELPFKITALGILPFTITYLNFETLRALKMIRDYAFLQNVSTFLFATLALFIALITVIVSNTTIISIFIGAVWITGLISQYKVLHVFKHNSIVQGRKLKTILKTALPMMVASSLMLIMGWTDTIMIGMFIDDSSVGVYSVALKVATITSITLMAINSMSAPKFAEFYAKNDMVSLQNVVNHVSKLIFWTSLPILLICVIFPEFILGVFGGEFTNGTWALIILCIGQFVNAVSGSVGYILQMTGQEKVFQKIIGISLALNIVLNYWFIPIYGIEGAAIASSISMIFWNLTAVYYIKKHIGFWTIIGV